MKIAVKDANIFIDLELMKLLDAWFQLGYETLTTSYIVDELERRNHPMSLTCIREGKVREIIIKGEELEALDQLYHETEQAGASLQDASVLYVAIQEKAVLLTGDRVLIRTSRIRQIESHGTLWILEQLVLKRILTSKQAAEKLEQLLSLSGSAKRFLPTKIATDCIQRWKELY